MTPVRGFATLTSLALLLLLTTYLAMGAASSAQLELELEKSPLADRRQAMTALGTALARLKDWDQQKQTFTRWSASHPVDGITWRSLSGRVNLNTVSPFVLTLPSFRETLSGLTVEKFVELRSLAGASADPQAYAEWIKPAALNSWYTVHSLWNLNTADEVMLEKMAAQRTSTALGSALRASLRSYREQKKRLTEDDWKRLVGVGSADLQPLTTIEPELDVNEAPSQVLAALLANPAWEVEQPAEKVSRIVIDRDSKPWSKESLGSLLALAEGNLLLSYLGTKTRFLEGEARASRGQLSFLIYLPDNAPARVVQTTWEVR